LPFDISVQIAALTGYEIKANKRNYRKQEDHLKISRYIRDVNNQKWDQNNGRKNKKEEILELYNAGVKKEKEIAIKLNIRIETVKRHLREEGLCKVKKQGGQSKEKSERTN
jgi:DNA-binding CsgD family transcriptional regulator